MGPTGPFDLTTCPPPKLTQENAEPEAPGLDITTYRESNLVAEPQKVGRKPGTYLACLKLGLLGLGFPSLLDLSCYFPSVLFFFVVEALEPH